MSRRAFTLIELLVTISILAIIASMLSVLLSIAQRQAKIANTKATMMKVDQAIRMFRTEMGINPWQGDLSAIPADLSQWTANPATFAWPNNLAYRLAWNPTAAQRTAYTTAMQADVSAIQARFAFIDGQNVGAPGGDGSHAFRCQPINAASYKTNILLTYGSSLQSVATIAGNGSNLYMWNNASAFPTENDARPMAMMLTRAACEAALRRYFAGQTPTTAPQGLDPKNAADYAAHPDEDNRYDAVPYRFYPYNRAGGAFGDDSRGPVLGSTTTPAAQGQGWRGDYLAGALRLRASATDRGDIDPTATAVLDAWGNPLVYVCSAVPAIKTGMSNLTLVQYGRPIDTTRYGMGAIGRSPTAALASDLRTTADATYALDFELWSAGPDGRFAVQRDDPADRDNVSLLPYAKNLQ